MALIFSRPPLAWMFFATSSSAVCADANRDRQKRQIAILLKAITELSFSRQGNGGGSFFSQKNKLDDGAGILLAVRFQQVVHSRRVRWPPEYAVRNVKYDPWKRRAGRCAATP